MPQTGKQESYGKVEVKRAKPGLDEIPANCGYMKKFKFNVDMNSNGISGDCIEWCQVNCEGLWGWWFEPAGQIVDPKNHWEDQNAYMSFEKKRDASRFWLTVGVQNMGNRSKSNNY
jgi:hypothetical protein